MVQSPAVKDEHISCNLPYRPLRTSRGLGWTTVDAGIYADPPVADEFEAETRQLVVHVVTSGRYEIARRRGRVWEVRQCSAGSLWVAAAGGTHRLRWRSLADIPMRSVHLHLDTAVAGRNTIPEAMIGRDPLLSAGAVALERALRGGAPALYADSVSQTLVMHLTWLIAGSVRPRQKASLSGQQIALLTDYMHARIAENVTIEELAALVDVSKFHFIRVFAATTGQTPYRYLRQIRMRTGADLLRATTRPVSEIAVMCGYRSAGQFAAAFRREHRVSPTEYRK